MQPRETKRLRKADQLLTEQRFSWLRPQPIRRQLVVTCCLAQLGVFITEIADWYLLGFIFLAALAVTAFALFRSTRQILSLPDALIDERIQQIRQESQSTAYGALTVLLGLVLFQHIVRDFSPDVLSAILQSTFLCALLLPTMIYAWRAPAV